MYVIELSGEIGWDVWDFQIKEELSRANGDDITVKMSTPGGNIIIGGNIYIMFLNYRRENPKAIMNLEIGAMAASYGSFLASSPVWNDIAIESISMFMIHNPWDIAVGDYRVMESKMAFLKSSRDLYSSIYAKKSGKSNDEMFKVMDETTWYMGDEIIENGFADRMLSSDSENDDERDKAAMIETVKSRMKLMEKNQRQMEDENKFNPVSAVASLKKIGQMCNLSELKETTPEPVKGERIADKPALTAEKDPSKEVPMTKAELKEKDAAVHDEILTDGVMKERKRVANLSALKQKEEYKSIPEVVAVIDKAIEDGTTEDAIQPLMMAAMVKIMKDPARVDEIESPGDIQGGDMKVTVNTESKKTHMEV